MYYLFHSEIKLIISAYLVRRIDVDCCEFCQPSDSCCVFTPHRCEPVAGVFVAVYCRTLAYYLVCVTRYRRRFTSFVLHPSFSARLLGRCAVRGPVILQRRVTSVTSRVVGSTRWPHVQISFRAKLIRGVLRVVYAAVDRRRRSPPNVIRSCRNRRKYRAVLLSAFRLQRFRSCRLIYVVVRCSDITWRRIRRRRLRCCCRHRLSYPNSTSVPPNVRPGIVIGRHVLR